MTQTTKPGSKPKAKKPTRRPKISTTDNLIRLLSRAAGSTMDEILAEVKVQRHTARAMISTLRTKRDIRIDLVDGRYKIIED